MRKDATKSERRETQRDRDTERQRHRETETDRQTDRDRDRDAKDAKVYLIGLWPSQRLY